MKHIALLIPTIDRIAGAERQVLLLAAGLARRGHRVTLIALSGTGSAVAPQLASAGVEFLSLGMRKGLADPPGWVRLHRWLRRQNPDVLHAHLPHAAWMARLARLFAPIPVVLDTLHTPHLGPASRRWTYRLTRRLSDAVTAVSQGVADAHVRSGIVLPTRLSVIPNGIDPVHWSPNPASRAARRHQLGIDAEFLWIAAGRLEPVKDYRTLLRAFAGLSPSNRLLIAGSGPLQPALQQLALELGVQSRVHFAGFLNDLRPSLHAADAFVMSSRWEGLPVALLEAGACALPAVAPDLPGIREILSEGRNGFLAAPSSADALCDAMARLQALDAPQRRAMGEAARLHIVSRFSLESVLDRWEILYDGLLRANPHPPRFAARP